MDSIFKSYDQLFTIGGGLVGAGVFAFLLYCKK